ncbi:MAG: hypothetical protein KBG62_04855, partial [Propionivibrio sp.]|nr:hypothetical protein [Propionivibrio sp.]
KTVCRQWFCGNKQRFCQAQAKKQTRRTLLPSLFPLHWQAHGIHAIALLITGSPLLVIKNIWHNARLD